MRTDVTVTHLEMGRPEQLIAAEPVPESELRFAEAEIGVPELARFFYRAVGGDWYWTDRIVWTRSQWQEWLDEYRVRMWVAYHRETPAGFFQLARHPGDDCEVAFLGFMRPFVGRGWGSWLVTRATAEAWATGAPRVWLQTCTLDHPAALPGYQKRGFAVFDRQAEVRDLPAAPPGPWRGAGR